MDSFDVVVIGGGPGGMSAALYASRAGLNTLIIEKEAFGGQLLNTEHLDNYLGSGSQNAWEVADSMSEQLPETVSRFIANVYKIKRTPTGNVFEIFTTAMTPDGEQNIELFAKSVILATGTHHNRLFSKETEGEFNNISYCAVCDFPFYKDKEVAVVGGGDSALEAAQLLSEVASKVHLIMRGTTRAKEAIVQNVFNKDNIRVLQDSPVNSIQNDGNGKMTLYVKSDMYPIKIQVSGLFPNIGSTPDNSLVLDLFMYVKENGYIKVNEKMETSVTGIYAIGDLVREDHKQVAIAVSDGAIAGLEAYDYVKNSWKK